MGQVGVAGWVEGTPTFRSSFKPMCAEPMERNASIVRRKRMSPCLCCGAIHFSSTPCCDISLPALPPYNPSSLVVEGGGKRQ